MTTYLALLRGINVSGQKLIKMAELKIMFEAMGFAAVKTYIQSGNVLFGSDPEISERALRERIEEKIAAVFGFGVSVIVRTAEEWEAIIQSCPYDAANLKEGESIYVTLLGDRPEPEDLKRIPEADPSLEEYRVNGREIYFLFHQSIRDSKVAGSLQKLKTPVTTRNWNTMNKLLALARTL
ncbi:DUF1697 domain-containing protein [Paenibacillus sp. UNC499MF]|uniref:DUF1697 domain-containing protein n=1 Tax=Paenibacillus sp. UNC499MF TaxID=1502751 RepID=UPI0008A05A48|nr:DUF1697 domain-containing protein [Paenibacillus sp. UNC499MF]SEG43579.1 Uncharacterized conserved protein, DUF1697 family [Paenibacillus sp. UNC499MF]